MDVGSRERFCLNEEKMLLFQNQRRGSEVCAGVYVVVQIPKKRIRGVCRTEDFRGISFTSLAYRAMYSIVHSRLVHMVEVKQLVAEEQGGFRKGRGCSV